MGWPAHNPELYGEMCERGIARWLEQEMEAYGYVGSSQELDAHLEMVAQVLYATKETRDAILTLAAEQIRAVEINHFASQIDAARDRVRDKGVG